MWVALKRAVWFNKTPRLFKNRSSWGIDCRLDLPLTSPVGNYNRLFSADSSSMLRWNGGTSGGTTRTRPRLSPHGCRPSQGVGCSDDKGMLPAGKEVKGPEISRQAALMAGAALFSLRGHPQPDSSPATRGWRGEGAGLLLLRCLAKSIPMS